MAQIKDVLKYQISKNSKKIKDLKDECKRVGPAEDWGYFDKDGNRFSHSQWMGRVLSMIPNDLKCRKYTYDKVFEHINPNDPRWNTYKALKVDTSILLTCLSEISGKNKTLDGTFFKIAHRPSEYKYEEWAKIVTKKIERLKKKMDKDPKISDRVDTWIQIKEMSTNA